MQKGKQKHPGRAASRSRSQPLTPGGREKVTQINVCIANKQMHDKHKDQLPLPHARWSKCSKDRRNMTDKEQGKTKHEAPRSVNYRATQNKNNIGTTALEPNWVRLFLRVNWHVYKHAESICKTNYLVHLAWVFVPRPTHLHVLLCNLLDIFNITVCQALFNVIIAW